MKLFNWLVRCYVGKTVSLVVDDIYANPERYSIKYSINTSVYRDGKEYMFLFMGGKIETLGRFYYVVDAKLIHQALLWAVRNGCTVN